MPNPSPPSTYPGRNQDLLMLIEKLDAAISKHIVWLKGFHQMLVCRRQPGSDDDVAENAHCRCAFGQWFYAEGIKELGGGDATAAIERLHREMHDAARELLLARQRDSELCSRDYERFMDLAIEFKSRLRAHQSELISRVCTVDHLTGAWNRHEMFHRLTQEVERCRRTGKPCVLVMMDIDHFKRVNDRYGHQVGDLVLKELTQHCIAQIRAYDAVFRYGGEEFLLCFPGSEVAEIVALVERLRRSISAHAFSIGDDRTLQITASFGIACLTQDKELDDALLEADHALLCAKSEGRDRFCAWEC